MQRLAEEHPDAHIALLFGDPWQLLVATVLSAQCTDKKVNEVTPVLFARYPAPGDLVAADQREVERIIRPTGFFRQKTKAIMAAARDVAEHHGGQVPATMEELTKLPGVGRKTANVILGNAFSTPGVVVDTHVRRLSARLGLTLNRDPDRIEQDLMASVPRPEWTHFSDLLIFHGRRICKAQRPACQICPVRRLCPASAFGGKTPWIRRRKSARRGV